MSSLLDRCRRLRRAQTAAEARLWMWLRGRRLSGLKFRRQHQFGFCILDFFCPERMIAVELDGSHHLEDVQASADGRRSDWLAARGVRVLRILNDDVFDHPALVLQRIAAMALGSKSAR